MRANIIFTAGVSGVLAIIGSAMVNHHRAEQQAQRASIREERLRIGFRALANSVHYVARDAQERDIPEAVKLAAQKDAGAKVEFAYDVKTFIEGDLRHIRDCHETLHFSGMGPNAFLAHSKIHSDNKSRYFDNIVKGTKISSIADLQQTQELAQKEVNDPANFSPKI